MAGQFEVVDQATVNPSQSLGKVAFFDADGNPIDIGGGGDAGVTSVNGETGAVVLAAADVGALATGATATAATKLATARAIALTGDVTGTANFDGTAPASITAAIGAGVVVNADVSASAAIAATKVAVAADATNGITAGTLQAALTELAARVKALETP